MMILNFAGAKTWIWNETNPHAIITIYNANYTLLYWELPYFHTDSAWLWWHALMPYIPHRYDSMLACWKMDPTERPTFSQLVVSLSGILDQLAEYFDLNAENHTSGFGNTSIGIQEEQQKQTPSLTLQDQSNQLLENVSLPASAQQCDSI